MPNIYATFSFNSGMFFVRDLVNAHSIRKATGADIMYFFTDCDFQDNGLTFVNIKNITEHRFIFEENVDLSLKNDFAKHLIIEWLLERYDDSKFIVSDPFEINRKNAKLFSNEEIWKIVDRELILSENCAHFFTSSLDYGSFVHEKAMILQKNRDYLGINHRFIMGLDFVDNSLGFEICNYLNLSEDYRTILERVKENMSQFKTARNIELPFSIPWYDPIDTIKNTDLKNRLISYRADKDILLRKEEIEEERQKIIELQNIIENLKIREKELEKREQEIEKREREYDKQIREAINYDRQIRAATDSDIALLNTSIIMFGTVCIATIYCILKAP